MKKICCLLLLFVFVFVFAITACSEKLVNADAASGTVQYTLREYFEMQISERGDSGEVAYFTTGQYSGDEHAQVFALVKNEGICDLWYADSSTVVKLVDNISVVDVPTVVTMSAKQMYIVDGTDANGVAKSYAYIVVDSKPVWMGNVGENLTSMGGDNFFTIVPSGDRKLSQGMLSGQSTRKYYLYFDGDSLREYGGVEISESEFLKLNKSDVVIKNIKECGYSVVGIIYRGNDLININCEKADNGEITYENLTVKMLGKNVVCLPSGLNQDADYVVRSSFGGRYDLAAFSDIAVYPEKIEIK